MASLATYAKLTPPSQFQPQEEVTFRMQYSEDLTLKYGTLIIDGYREALNDGTVYTGTKQTLELNHAVGGQWLAEYIIPANTLGKSFPEGDSGIIGFSGKMQARVEIGNELDDEGYVINPVFTSNVVLVDMIVLRDETIRFIYLPYQATGSIYRVSLYCDHIINYGADSNEDVQSYRILLYDNHYNLLDDSGELYDWDTNLYGNTFYTFYNLKDDSTYYVRGYIKLNGGYSLSTSYIPITVHYEDIPVSSDIFILTPYLGTVKLQIDLSEISHTKVIFSRTVINESDYMEIAKVENPENLVTTVDKYPIPTKTYTYRATVFNGELIVGTYYNNISFSSNYVTISDIFRSFSAVGNITKHPINRNDRGSILETMDSKYPYHILNGEPDYDSGQVDGFFSEIDDDCNIKTDNVALSNILRAWLNNGKAKLLTYYTGEAWIVTVNGVSTTDPDNNDVYNTSFNWTAIGDANKMSEYVRLGLVVQNE